MEAKAREKAKELVNKFYDSLPQWVNTNDAKQCALILCDELIEFEKQIILQLEKDTHLKGGVLIVKNLLWEQLKQEIEKL
jgi:hypothetical protein